MKIIFSFSCRSLQQRVAMQRNTIENNSSPLRLCLFGDEKPKFPLKIHLLLYASFVSAFLVLRLYFSCCYTTRLSLLNIFSYEADVFFVRENKFKDLQVHLFLKEEKQILFVHDEHFVEFCEKSFEHWETIEVKYQKIEDFDKKKSFQSWETKVLWSFQFGKLRS